MTPLGEEEPKSDLRCVAEEALYRMRDIRVELARRGLQLDGPDEPEQRGFLPVEVFMDIWKEARGMEQEGPVDEVLAAIWHMRPVEMQPSRHLPSRVLENLLWDLVHWQNDMFYRMVQGQHRDIQDVIMTMDTRGRIFWYDELMNPLPVQYLPGQRERSRTEVKPVKTEDTKNWEELIQLYSSTNGGQKCSIVHDIKRAIVWNGIFQSEAPICDKLTWFDIYTSTAYHEYEVIGKELVMTKPGFNFTLSDWRMNIEKAKDKNIKSVQRTEQRDMWTQTVPIDDTLKYKGCPFKTAFRFLGSSKLAFYICGVRQLPWVLSDDPGIVTRARNLEYSVVDRNDFMNIEPYMQSQGKVPVTVPTPTQLKTPADGKVKPEKAASEKKVSKDIEGVRVGDDALTDYESKKIIEAQWKLRVALERYGMDAEASDLHNMLTQEAFEEKKADGEGKEAVTREKKRIKIYTKKEASLGIMYDKLIEVVARPGIWGAVARCVVGTRLVLRHSLCHVNKVQEGDLEAINKSLKAERRKRRKNGLSFPVVT